MPSSPAYRVPRLKRPSETQPLLGDAYLNQPTSLLGSSLESSVPLLKDERLWIRWPINIFYRLPSWLCTPLAIFYSPYTELKSPKIFSFLLPFVPLGIIGYSCGWRPQVVFLFNLIAIISLVAPSQLAADALSTAMGAVFGTLMNLCLQSEIELVISVTALTLGDIQNVQYYITGTVLCNLFLVFGVALLSPGTDRVFTNSSVNESLKFLGIFGAEIATGAFVLADPTDTGSRTETEMLICSRLVVPVILLLYCVFLSSELVTINYDELSGSHSQEQDSDLDKDYSFLRVGHLLTLVVMAYLTAQCGINLVHSATGVMERTRITNVLIWGTSLPLGTNAFAIFTAYTLARRDRGLLAVGMAFQSCARVCYFVLPCLVLLGWVMGKPMPLIFNFVEGLLMGFGIAFVIMLVWAGKCTYISGILALALYTLLSIVFSRSV